MHPLPKKPLHISPFAEAALLALARQGYGQKLSLGGAFGLAYYLEYRSTHDVDAWWIETATSEEQLGVQDCIESALAAFGAVSRRSWGSLGSVELTQGERTVFSFKIAARSAQLAPLIAAPWPEPLLLDSLDDLVASKMAALIERGAPRDFRDIHALCMAQLTGAVSCWSLWRRRQQLSRGDLSASRARTAILTHLARIEVHRPLALIPDSGDRAAAAQLRGWFKKEFLDALVD